MSERGQWLKDTFEDSARRMRDADPGLLSPTGNDLRDFASDHLNRTEKPPMNTAVTNTYVQLPLCVDNQGHRFRIAIGAGPSRACCERCGLIRAAVHTSVPRPIQ